MLVMFVVHVAVVMLENFMPVIVLMSLGQMQPKTAAHQQSSQRQLGRERLAKQQDRDNRSDERRQ